MLPTHRKKIYPDQSKDVIPTYITKVLSIFLLLLHQTKKYSTCWVVVCDLRQEHHRHQNSIDCKTTEELHHH